MFRKPEPKSELDRKIEELDSQLRHLSKLIQDTSRGKPVKLPGEPVVIQPVRQPWKASPEQPPAVSPAAAPVRPAASPPSPAAGVNPPTGGDAVYDDPEDQKRRFASYFSSGPMLRSGPLRVRRERRHMMGQILVMLTAIGILGMIVVNLAGC